VTVNKGLTDGASGTVTPFVTKSMTGRGAGVEIFDTSISGTHYPV
jgi:hypothetical protein